MLEIDREKKKCGEKIYKISLNLFNIFFLREYLKLEIDSSSSLLLDLKLATLFYSVDKATDMTNRAQILLHLRYALIETYRKYA